MSAQQPVANRCVNVLTGLLLVLFVFSILMPDKGISSAGAKRIKCISNIHQVGLALQMYAEDGTHRMPTANRWCDKLALYLRYSKPFSARQVRFLTCPALPPGSGGYAFNARLADTRIAEFDQAKLVLLFESHRGWNIHGGPELVLPEPRHPKGSIFLFEDNHVSSIDEMAHDQVVWVARKHH